MTPEISENTVIPGGTGTGVMIPPRTGTDLPRKAGLNPARNQPPRQRNRFAAEHARVFLFEFEPEGRAI